MVNPDGSDGHVDHEMLPLTLMVGWRNNTDVFLLSVSSDVLSENAVTMLIVIVAVSFPPVLMPVMVYCVDDDKEVGVPRMAPPLSMYKPVGRAGVTVAEATGPPIDVGVRTTGSLRMNERLGGPENDMEGVISRISICKDAVWTVDHVCARIVNVV